MAEVNMHPQELIDLCDASTVLNYRCHKKGRSNKDTNEVDNLLNVKDKIKDSDPSDGEVVRLNKVASWLDYSNFSSSEKETINEEPEFWTTETWLDEEIQNKDGDESGSQKIFRMRVYLIDIEPKIEDEPLDLVSGYCFSGCRNLSLFSTIIWEETNKTVIPYCPYCQVRGQEKELKLVYMFKLHVMDTTGKHCPNFYVCKEEAETFFGCSVRDYIKNQALREERIEYLKNFMLFNSLHRQVTALMDVSILVTKNIYFVVNSRLDIPSPCIESI